MAYGYVALLGAQVSNGGAINAPKGSVAPAAGEQVTLTLRDGGLAGLNVDRDADAARRRSRRPQRRPGR